MVTKPTCHAFFSGDSSFCQILYDHTALPPATRRLSLITSDAADDLIGVDLGGRRILKKTIEIELDGDQSTAAR